MLLPPLFWEFGGEVVVVLLAITSRHDSRTRPRPERHFPCRIVGPSQTISAPQHSRPVTGQKKSLYSRPLALLMAQLCFPNHLVRSVSNLVGTASQGRFAGSTMEVAKKLQIPGDEQDRQRPWSLASSRLRAIRPGRSRCHFRAPCSRAQTKRIVGELTANDVQTPLLFCIHRGLLHLRNGLVLKLVWPTQGGLVRQFPLLIRLSSLRLSIS